MNERARRFLEKAKKKHCNKFNYDLDAYVNMHTKIKIVCPEHGPYLQTPKNHLDSSTGCPKCGKLKSSNGRSLTYEDFLEKVGGKYSMNYEYVDSELVRINGRSSVKILCRKHNHTYTQLVSNHYRNSGCKYCKNESLYNLKVDTKEGFISKAREVCGDRYTYDDVEYYNSQTPVDITCSYHGNFKIRPNNLLNGRNCPRCTNAQRLPCLSEDVVEKNKGRLVKEYSCVYVLKIPNTKDIYKIGLTNSIGKRLSNLKKDIGEAQVIHQMDSNRYVSFHVESFLHNLFDSCKVKSDIVFGGHTELFKLTEDHIKFIVEFTSEVKEDWHIGVQ